MNFDIIELFVLGVIGTAVVFSIWGFLEFLIQTLRRDKP